MDQAHSTVAAPSLPGFERLVRALLAATAEFGGFDVTYLTVIDWSRRAQTVRYACNVGSEQVAEGHRITCPPELDEQMFLGVTRSNGLPTPQPDSQVARGLGMATYVSVPVVTLSHRLYGTLCGASRVSAAVDDSTVASMQCFASLLSDHMARAETDDATRRTAEAERKLEERSQFLAESEHKLKTHLAVISGWATTLSEQGHRLTSVERASAVEVIRNQADQLGVELQRMLEQARTDIGPIQLEPVEVDIAALVRESARTLNGAAPHHSVECFGAESVIATADRDVLHQVLAHLIDNAVKYSPRGSTVGVSVSKSGQWAVIEVKDCGIGVPEGVDVFAAFERGEDDTVQATHGVGLGLHIVRTLVQAMGGVVSARRNMDGGSTFTVLVPAAVAAVGGGR
jgi:K+-sensing histidine kinase KdpD